MLRIASVCSLLSEWITFLLAVVPPRSRRTFFELLIGCMLNPEGGHPRHQGDLPQCALDHLLEADRVSVRVGRRAGCSHQLQLVQRVFPAELVNLIIDDALASRTAKAGPGFPMLGDPDSATGLTRAI